MMKPKSAPATPSPSSEPVLDEEETIDAGSAPATPSPKKMMPKSAPATPSTSTGKEEDEDYMTEFLNLYPFAGVDFFVSESRENGEGDLAANEHTITKAAEDHYYAEPEECLPCAELH